MKAPQPLRDIRGWLLWKYVSTPGDKKPRKVPYYVGGRIRQGVQGSAEDRSRLATFDAALAAFDAGGWEGLGFIMLPDWGLVGLDFDNAVDADGNLLPEVEALVMGTYAEWSPSGRGVHAFMRGAIADKKSRATEDVFGFETFCGSGFLTFTGNVLPICDMVGNHDKIEDLTPEVLELFAQRFPGTSTKWAAKGAALDDDPLMTYSPPLNASDDEIRGWLALTEVNTSYEEWLKVGMALHHETAGDIRGLELWDEWSATGNDYPTEGRVHLEGKWDSFGRLGNRAPLTLRGVRRRAIAAKHKDDIVLDAKDHLTTAVKFLDTQYQGDDGATLMRCGGLWYYHVGSHWAELPAEDLRADMWQWLSAAKKHGKDGEIVSYMPSPSQIDATLDALRSAARGRNLRAPCWLPGFTGAPAADLISMANGILHIESRRLLPPTSSYFTLNALPYGWDEDIEPVEWLKFLDQVFPGDDESRQTLQEMFGYLLTADTSQQKMFLIIGPKRSGKGTIGRVLGSLVGRGNLVSPTLTSLTSNFGMQPLIDKLVALVPDARVGAHSNTQAVVEKLLMVSGEDDITVDRKNRDAWSGKLSARFVFLTNETPQLGDASGALAGRFITLEMRESFYGREDLGLGARLQKELPGILRWALDGLDRLRARGHFIQPAAGMEDMEEMAALSSPISAFVSEACEMGPGLISSLDDLYAAWTTWCADRGRTSMWGKDLFAKNLRAAFRGLQKVRNRVDGRQKPHYAGIRVQESYLADALLDF
ncbi:hypothetical protein CAL26_09920 [Bordetella genomosp. 9]|uniref:SF3 helicase domain-containing protein n=1 Tax=Bordetella genomosp. 9 TaxID=1416803 RepID=A0A261RFC0_9BORD|nr:phage/plasmid primase, P4 family [Bordetella genomosp. 9]OZI23738.1 hypothetical protein CAL26_09920 [Bordetella genomosp. 9]